MLNEEKFQQAIKEYCKDPDWKKEYDSAPTPLSRRYVALESYWSDFYNVKGWREEKQKLEDAMGLEDWEFLCWHTGVNPFRGLCMRKIEEFKTKQQDEEMKNLPIIATEELFTKDEMDEALKHILSEEKSKQKYEKAPSDTLRRCYLLEECFVVRGNKNGVEGVLDGATTMIWQLQDAFTLKDWKYEFYNATTKGYKWECTQKVRELSHNDHWQKSYWHK